MKSVYDATVDLSYFVFHPWTTERPSVNADWLLTASMSLVVFGSKELQIFLVQFETLVGHLRVPRHVARIMVAGQISESLSVY